MKIRVERWGKSLAIRIPNAFAQRAGLRPSTEVEVSLQNGELRLAPVRRRFHLDQLLPKVTKRNRHAEFETDRRFLKRIEQARRSLKQGQGVRLEQALKR